MRLKPLPGLLKGMMGLIVACVLAGCSTHSRRDQTGTTAPSPLDVREGSASPSDLSASHSAGKDRLCGTQGASPQEIAKLVAELKLYSSMPHADLLTFTEPGSVHVYVHVITGAHGEGNVTNEQIRKLIDALRNAMNGQDSPDQGTPLPRASIPVVFEFNPDHDIHRPPGNDAWFNMTEGSSAEAQCKKACKEKLGGYDKKALHIFTARSEQDLGWSTNPYVYKEVLDGVVIAFPCLPDGAEVGYNRGDVLVHEVGHWLGLWHTFEGGCTYPNDGITDTPAVRSYYLGGCPVPQNLDTCSQPGFYGKDPVENYMDLTPDGCRYRFTQGQSDQIASACARYRGL